MNPYDNIPAELKALRQWVCWKYEDRKGKPTKVPVNPRTGERADTTDLKTWSSFGEALAMFSQCKNLAGIGFVFSPADPYVGIDIDNCIREDGSFTEEADQAIAAFGNSYYEISPCGKGLKFWIRGKLPTPKSGRNNRRLGVEAYQCSRFFTMTGCSLSPTSQPIADCNAALQKWFMDRFTDAHESQTYDFEEIECPVSAEVIIQRAVTEDAEFQSLFSGDMSRQDEDHSAADFALCRRIARWAGPDQNRVHEVFQESALYREKWNRLDYRARTISKAIVAVQNHPQGFFDWSGASQKKDLEELMQSIALSGFQISQSNSQRSAVGNALTETMGVRNDLRLAVSTKIDFGFIDSIEFAAMKFTTSWLINSVLKANQPCIIAGPSKSMKTTFLVEMCISLSSGQPLWRDGRYGTHAVRVALISAESGEETLQETAKRICRSKGIELTALATNLFWAFRAPDISAVNHLESLKEFLLANRIDVIAIDPAYLSMGDIGDSVNNQFSVGAVLQKLTWLMQETGATVILAAHTGKGCKAGRQLELADIAHAGFGQWARQWILINRRVAYDGTNPGRHELWISYGGSAGHSGVWAVDIEEGNIENGRTWHYTVLTGSGIQPLLPGGLASANRVNELSDRIMDVISDTPESADSIAKKIGVSRNGQKFREALDSLVVSHDIVLTESTREGSSPIKRYSRFPDSDASEFTEQPNSLSCQPDKDA